MSKHWTHDESDSLKAMAKAGWSIAMICAQLGRQPHDVESMAEVMKIGPLLTVRREDPSVERCKKCQRTQAEPCPYAATVCGRIPAFKAEL